MKYYRASKPRKKSMFALYYYLKNREKSNYMIDTGRSKMLESGFFENQVWGALDKAWKGYKIAKSKEEDDKMELYARRIQECQHDLGLEVSSFDNIGMSASDFLSEMAHKEGNEQEASYREDYQTDDQYEQERLTDSYSEYLRD